MKAEKVSFNPVAITSSYSLIYGSICLPKNKKKIRRTRNSKNEPKPLLILTLCYTFVFLPSLSLSLMSLFSLPAFPLAFFHFGLLHCLLQTHSDPSSTHCRYISIIFFFSYSCRIHLVLIHKCHKKREKNNSELKWMTEVERLDYYEIVCMARRRRGGCWMIDSYSRAFYVRQISSRYCFATYKHPHLSRTPIRRMTMEW